MSKANKSKAGGPKKVPAATTYGVGYAKPPIETRFKRGQSGNPKGRPKKEIMGMQAAVEEVLRQKIPVTESGLTRKISPLLALAKSAQLQALTGGTAQKRFWLQQIEKLNIDFELASPSSAAPGAEKQSMVLIVLPHNERDMIDWRARAEAIKHRPELKKYYEAYLRAAEVDEAAEAEIPPDKRPKKLKF